jgi:hypothetical protein
VEAGAAQAGISGLRRGWARGRNMITARKRDGRRNLLLPREEVTGDRSPGADARPRGIAGLWRERLRAAEPALECLLAFGYALMLLAFFLIRDHDFLRHWSYVTVVVPFLLIARREEWALLVRSPILIASTAYLAWLGSSLWWSPEPSTADAVLLARDALATLAFLGSTVVLARRRPAFFPHLFRALCCVAAITAVIAIGLYVTDDSVPPLDRAYAFGLGGYPTREAMLHGVVALAILYWLLPGARTRTERLALTAALAAILGFILAAQARGAMVGLLATFLLGGLLLRQKPILFGVPLVIGAYLLVHFSGAIDAYDLISRGTTQRTLVWDLALERSVLAPWLGYGIGDPQDFFVWGGELRIIHPHNILLSHQLAGGFPAVALFLMLLSLWFVAGIRMFFREGNYLLLALLVFVAVVGLVDLEVFLGPLDIEWLYFWLPLGLATATEIRLRGSRPAGPSEPSPCGSHS